MHPTHSGMRQDFDNRTIIANFIQTEHDVADKQVTHALLSVSISPQHCKRCVITTDFTEAHVTLSRYFL